MLNTCVSGENLLFKEVISYNSQSSSCCDLERPEMAVEVRGRRGVITDFRMEPPGTAASHWRGGCVKPVLNWANVCSRT